MRTKRGLFPSLPFRWSMPAMLYLTAPDRATAFRIARRLLDDRLIACANVFEAQSIYRWEGRTVRAREAVAVMKTSSGRVGAALRAAKRLHPDRVPCVVAYRMAAGDPDYLAWVNAETRAPPSRRTRRRRASGRRPRSSRT